MTAPTAFDRLLDRLDCVRRNGNKATARCPAHEDHKPSLSITKIEGRILAYCHGGCAIEAVLEALGLAKRDLFDDPRGVSYRYDDGRTVYRTPSKKFRQEAAPKGASTLYRLSRVREAVAAGATVYLVEGEQDVHAMESLSIVATTAPMGARNFKKVDASPLFGSTIVVIPDLDEAGQKWARQVLGALNGKVDSLRFMAPKIGKDAADHVAAGYGLGDFVPGEPPVEPLEEVEPDVLPSPGNPMGVARVIIRDHKTDDGDLTLRHWRGGWMQWRGTHWVEAEEHAIKSWTYGRLEGARYWDARAEELRPWNPNRRKVGDVLDALAAVAHTAEAIDTPSWLDSVRDGPQDQSSYRATEIVACSDGLLQVGTRKLLELTPLFYNRVAVPFAYDATAPQPTRWLAFLDQLWPDDPESIAALQEFFGYVLSGRTDLHKILLLIGPTRSGKGTIARVLSALLGNGNVAGPTLASLGTNFGLSPLLGKPLAVVSDARLAGGNVHQVVERLLSISGEDLLTVDRKYKEPWSGKLPSRFLILSNELPRFGDASGAIANRFVVLTMHESFLGKENMRLTEELTAELTGILSWALDGLDRLTRQGRFTEPKSSLDSILALQDLVSPKAAFVRDCCEVGIGYEISVAGLFDAWKVWAEINGHRPGTVQTFGRDIRAVVPSLRQARPRDGEDRERRYVGIRLKSTGHDGGDRGPVWTTGQNSAHNWQNSAPVRDGPQPNPLWGEGPRRPGMPNLGECSVCGGPMWIVEPGQRTHPNCDPGETDQRARR